jgi:recombination protein RecT
MAETKTREQTTVPPVQQAQPIAKVEPAAQQRRESWENFRDELTKRADEIGSQLPSNVSRDRFTNACIAAVKATPAILGATPRSLFSAIVKAAQDGLLPDGREGIITVFSTKVPNTTPQQYENVAQWNPMFYGIRKRARELDGIIIDAQVVVEGDEFDYELGDEPRINHKPKARSEVIDASKGIAVYAIFRHPTEGILHREVMWKPEVFAVMNQSRAKDSLMWTKFWTEGWRKTVGRRGAKSVPVSAQLERLIQRDDENFDFPKSPVMIGGPSGSAPPPPPPEEPEPPAPPPLPKMEQPADDLSEGDSGFTPEGEITPEVEKYLVALSAELTQAIDEASVNELFDRADPQSELAGNTLAISRAFQIKADFINALATKQREDAEAAGQGSMFPGDAPMPKART